MFFSRDTAITRVYANFLYTIRLCATCTETGPWRKERGNSLQTFSPSHVLECLRRLKRSKKFWLIVSFFFFFFVCLFVSQRIQWTKNPEQSEQNNFTNRYRIPRFLIGLLGKIRRQREWNSRRCWLVYGECISEGAACLSRESWCCSANFYVFKVALDGCLSFSFDGSDLFKIRIRNYVVIIRNSEIIHFCAPAVRFKA